MGKHEIPPQPAGKRIHPLCKRIFRFCMEEGRHVFFELPAGLAAILVAEEWLLPSLSHTEVESVHALTFLPF